MNSIENVSPKELGERLRISRENKKLTQEQAALSIGISRTTLVAIEKGERRIRINELQKLSHYYGISVNALMRNEAIHVDFTPRFRKLSATNDPDIDDAVQLLNNLVSAETELENILGINRVRNYPPERQILPGDIREQAEQDSLWLRQYLGLDQAPIADIVSLMELNLGIRVYQRKLPSKISGLFSFDEKIGACILLNAAHPKDRRTQSAAHELGHFVGTRQSPEVLDETETYQSRDERYANAFGHAFLTPSRTVMQKFKDITAGSSHFSRRHVILLAYYFGVSREAIVRRLEELKLVRSGTWDWFESNGKITMEHVRQVLGDAMEAIDPVKQEAIQILPARIGSMVLEVWQRGLLSEGQLAKLLNISRTELRTFIDDLNVGEGEVNELLKLP